MAKTKGGLGRGLGALLPDWEEEVQHDAAKHEETIALDLLYPNPEQPRKDFDEDDLID